MLVLRYKKVSALFVALSLAYLAQAVFFTANKSALVKYHITRGQDLVISLTFAVVLIAIWIVGLFGYVWLRAYSEAISEGEDGAAFTAISRAVLLIALWLPASTVVGGFLAHFYTVHPATSANLVRLNNYLNVGYLLATFWCMYNASKQLLGVLKRRPVLKAPQLLNVIFICFAALYVLLALHDPTRRAPTANVAVASYYEPDWLIVLTLLIPRLIMWFLGALAVQNIYLYQKRVKGVLYKASLAKLALGVGSAVVVTIIIRCIQSLAEPLSRLHLGPVLAVIYVLLIVISVGYILIAKGARDLRKIEEL